MVRRLAFELPPQKCCVMHIGHQNEEKTYFMNVKDSDLKHSLAKTEAEKDLGVTVDNKLSFKQKSSDIKSKQKSWHHKAHF